MRIAGGGMVMGGVSGTALRLLPGNSIVVPMRGGVPIVMISAGWSGTWDTVDVVAMNSFICLSDMFA